MQVCKLHNHPIYNANRTGQVDPTRTILLRRQFEGQMARRFRKVKGLIRDAVIVKDCFGLRKQSRPGLTMLVESGLSPQQFAFTRSSEKVDAFMSWLSRQVDQEVLELHKAVQVGAGIEKRWTDTYVRSAYQKGIQSAQAKLKKAGYALPDNMLTTGTITGGFLQPVHVDRLGLIYTRVFRELKGITNEMDQVISRVLTEGIARGDGPEKIAQALNRIIELPRVTVKIPEIGYRRLSSLQRAKLLARTEVIRAHHSATIQEYRNWGVEGVKVLAEWLTAGDDRVCPECEDMAFGGDKGQGIYSLDRIEGMIPLHPNCRCSTIPLDVTDKGVPPELGKEQKKTWMASADRYAPCVLTEFTNLAATKPAECSDYVRMADGRWMLRGQAVPDEVAKRLDKMGIPPAWRKVVVATDPKAKIQVVGMDKAGRWQYRYSAEHIEEAARKKFNRVKLFSRDMPGIRKKVDRAVLQNDPRAMLLRLEDQTAIRIGSDTDFKARKKAYGLTTLQKRHIRIDGDKIILDFTAKEGIPAHYEVHDRTVADWLSERLRGLAPEDKVFPDVPAKKLNNYLKEIAGGKSYTVKDFRTYHGTRIAHSELQQYAGKELTKKEKKKIVKEVSTKVSNFLANTPAMAKKSYIDPMVWEIIGGV